ncbi:MAG: PAS domain S-box protein [Candidatus Delongbacteria bacterium]|nr:PAS domain S-box protein [Candidatus Delongbacteria bacterium]
MYFDGFTGMINNAAFLVLLVLLYDLTELNRPNTRLVIQAIRGVVMGMITISIMMNSWTLMPGVFFDTRSVILSVGSLYFGAVSSLIMTGICGLFRLYQGGEGVWAALSVILCSSLIGLGWRFIRRSHLKNISAIELYLMGIVVHLAMLLSMLIMSLPTALGVLSDISLPVMLIYPPATILLGKLMSSRLSRRQAERLLAESEKKFRRYVDFAPDGIFLADIGGNFLDVNPKACELTGYSRDELLRMKLFQLSPDGNESHASNHFNNLIQHGVSIGDIPYSRKNGEQRFWTVSAVKLSDDEFLGFALDSTDRIRTAEKLQTALEEKELLIREIYHRTKNNMQIITSMLYLKSSQSKHPEIIEVFKEIQAKIQSMSLVHYKLYQSQNLAHIDLKDYITDLAKLLQESLSNSSYSAVIELRLEPVKVSFDIAVSCGLIVNELVTNAFKYAFPNRNDGVITIILSHKENDRIELSIADNGVGLPAHFDLLTQGNWGTKLIASLVSSLPQGKLDWNSGPGLSIAVRFSLDRLSSPK